MCVDGCIQVCETQKSRRHVHAGSQTHYYGESLNSEKAVGQPTVLTSVIAELGMILYAHRVYMTFNYMYHLLFFFRLRVRNS